MKVQINKIDFVKKRLSN